MPPDSFLSRRLLPVVWLIAALVLAVNMAREQLFAQLSGAGAGDLIGVFVLALAFGALLKWHNRLGIARGVLLAFALLLVFRIGAAPVLATLMIAAAAWVIGRAVCADVVDDVALQVVVGLALLLGVVGWLLPLPVHLRGVYAFVFVLLIVRQWPALRSTVREATAPLWRPQFAPGSTAVFAILVIGYIGLPTGLPTAMFDDLSYHLALPTDLAMLGYYRMDAQSQVWALAPWGSDVVHGIAQVLAGGEARGAVHWLWFLLALRLLWCILDRESVEARWRWLGLALFASQPLHLQMSHSMQTEMPTQTLLLALLLLIGRVDATAPMRLLLAIGAVVGALLSMKLTSLFYLAPLALWFAWRWRSPALHRLLPAALLMLAVGASSYVYAYVLSGNPVLPLFNDVFQSPLAPLTRFEDSRYQGGLAFDLPWQMIFSGSTLHEGWNGSGGFQWLFAALALPWLLGHARSRHFALIGVASVVLVCTQIVHLRYVLPALIGLGIALTIYLAHRHPRGGALFALGLIAMNLLFAQSSSWMLRHGTLLRYQLRVDGNAHFLETHAPDRLLLAPLRAGATPFLVFGGDTIYRHAELSGRGVSPSDYDPQTKARYLAAIESDDPSRWRALFAEYGVTHAIAHLETSDPRYLRALDAIGTLQTQVNNARLYRMPPWPLPVRTIADTPKLERAIDLAGDSTGDLEFSADVRCHTVSEKAVVARLFFDDLGWAGARMLAWQPCRHDRAIRVSGSTRVKAQYARALFQFDGPLRDAVPDYVVDDLQFHWRRDLAAERDAARRLLGKYR